VGAQRMRKPTVLDSAWRASAPPCVACGRAAAECRAESDFHRLSFYEATRGLEGLFTATFVSHPRNNRVSALRVNPCGPYFQIYVVRWFLEHLECRLQPLPPGRFTIKLG
jgi:hypothetical protein